MKNLAQSLLFFSILAFTFFTSCQNKTEANKEEIAVSDSENPNAIVDFSDINKGDVYNLNL